MTTQLTFHETQFNVIPHNNQMWLSAPQVASALEYADQSSVNRIYGRHSDEFTRVMTASVKLTDPNGNQQETRIFSLRGAHLIAMFARTPVAKEFRRWVLDVLEREVFDIQSAYAINWKIPVHNINAVCIHLDVIHELWMKELHPALKAMRSPLAAKLYDRVNDACMVAHLVRADIERETGLKGLQYGR